MGWIDSYRMRLIRRRLRAKALVRSRDLAPVADRTGTIRAGDILVLSTMRNERPRLAAFLRHYRKMGVAHFLVVDNGSTDGTGEILADQGDISLWRTNASYRAARFGADWLGHLASRYGHGHWCLTVDADERLIYPFHDTRPLAALTDWLDDTGARAFPAMLLDLYPKGPIGADDGADGEDALDAACWFDAGNYTIERNWRHRNLWIQGGPRARAFFADDPHRAPALNKIPLVNWRRHYAYSSSTHALLPRGLNLTYDEWGGEKTSGLLLHTKLTARFGARAAEEAARAEHYAEAREYRRYAGAGAAGAELWHPWSERLTDWRQLEELGLMSRGDWA